MSYNRVIPRDLFNEAKLLKCLGQLSLIIHDEVGVPRGLKLEHYDSEHAGFQIEQQEQDGALYCANLECLYRGRVVGLRSPYNSKDAYPLQYIVGDDEDTGRVFTHDGALTAEFISAIKSLS